MSKSKVQTFPNSNFRGSVRLPTSGLVQGWASSHPQPWKSSTDVGPLQFNHEQRCQSHYLIVGLQGILIHHYFINWSLQFNHEQRCQSHYLVVGLQGILFLLSRPLQFNHEQRCQSHYFVVGLQGILIHHYFINWSLQLNHELR